MKKMTLEERVDLFRRTVEIYLPDNVFPWLYENGFFTQVASTKFHGSYEGGLFDHSYTVMDNLCKLSVRNDLKWLDERSPIVVGMFHDLCKIDEYACTEGGIMYVRDTPIKGHGSKSVTLLSDLMDLTEEEELCIKHHMGAFGGKGEALGYTDAIHRYPNVLWTHLADMMAAHIDNV